MLLRVPAGRSRSASGVALVALLLAPLLARAQLPIDQDTARGRLRDRVRSPQTSQKLDENIRKLESDDAEKRIEGIRGLGELNDPKGFEYLAAAVNDPDPRIRIKAIDTLGHMRAKDAVPLLVQRLFMRDTDAGTTQRILAALGKIGDARATGPIVDFLSRDVDAAIRGNAIFALGDIGDAAALPPLEAVAAKSGEDDVLRGLALEAIRKIRERPAPAVVPPALAVDRRGPGGPATP
jgi:HEAT repeat protein